MRIKSLLKLLDGLSEWSGRIFVWLVIPLTIAVVFEVISRRFFNSPHIWSTEVIDFIYGPHFMLAAAYTLLYKAHVKIDVIYDKFSPRTRGILDIITYMVFFFPFCIIVFYQGVIFAHTSWAMGETSDSAALRILPLIKTVIPVAIGLLLMQGIATYIRAIIQAIKGEEI
ncbi:MAG: TRAP transporter small permease subunit [Proteobacteria bacterium]|nr:TRAP transporter small permease subunit [Desulfobacterales bacterium]MBL7173200.1 TRAP transporter small permease subunit [Desulfobacteraceae bacterium]MBU0734819.1 TRAP transporter small permease subunit [Pseudomonadota bacterium]MBU1905307.1 TRAP transporter small permease subunit [Pseudomonadota bacterium]